MPTRIDSFYLDEDAFDALTIFIDERKEPSEEVKKKAAQLFRQQEYLFVERPGFSGEGFVKFLRDELDSMNVMLPRSNRLLTCFFLELTRLSDNWIDSFFEIARALRRFQPTYEIFSQHFVICLSYNTGDIEAAEWGDYFRLLQRLGREEIARFSKHIYLLRGEGFNNPIEYQERGMVQLLHILSRRDYRRVDEPMDIYKNFLKMISFSEFYADQANECERQINSIADWLDIIHDPNLSLLIRELVELSEAPIQDLRREARTFSQRQGLFPVNVQDLHGNWIRGYEKNLSNAQKEKLEQYRIAFTSQKGNTLANQCDFSKIIGDLNVKYGYQDWNLLYTAIRDNSLEERIFRKIDEKIGPDTFGIISGFIYSYVSNFVRCVSETMTNHLKQREDKEHAQRKARRERIRAGRYNSLDDCFDRIINDSLPGPLSGEYPAHSDQIVLISDRCYENRGDRDYNITYADCAFVYPPIDPAEIVVLYESDIVDLARGDETEQALYVRFANEGAIRDHAE